MAQKLIEIYARLMEDTRISLTLHAMGVIEERQIALEWIARVVAEPALLLADQTDPSLVHAFGRGPEREGRVLRVVYNPGADYVLVVTAFFDRSMKGKL